MQTASELSPASVRARAGRKCFARWMNEAGIPRTRRRAYLGHAAREDVTDRYEGYSPEQYFDEDRRLVPSIVRNFRRRFRAIPNRR